MDMFVTRMKNLQKLKENPIKKISFFPCPFFQKKSVSLQDM